MIKVARPGVTVLSRRGRYSDVVPLSAAAGSTAASAVDSVDRFRPLSARGTLVPLPAAEGKKIPVAVVVEVMGPIDLTVDTQGNGALDLDFHLVARVEGEVADRYERSFTASVRPEKVAPIRGGFRVEGRLALLPGIYEIQGVVRLGNPQQLATWSATLPVPPVPKGAVITGAFLAPADGPEPPLLSRPPDVSGKGDSLEVASGGRLLPATSWDFDGGRALLAAFWLHGFPGDGAKPPPLDLSVKVATATGAEVNAPVSLVEFRPDVVGGYRAVARVETAALEAGAYVLRLEAALRDGSAPPARHTIPFAIHAKEAESAPTAATSSSSP